MILRGALQLVPRRSWRWISPDCANQHRYFSSRPPFYGIPRPPKANRLSEMSFTERAVIAIHSATTALADPKRADAVATLGEVTGTVALIALRHKMQQHATGQRILLEKPIVDGSALENGNNKDTFGHAYTSFMQHHGFNPEERDQVKYIDDSELAYIMLRYRQIHDFSHVLCNLPPTVLGELALKWLELFQTGLPVAALSATVGVLQLNEKERQILHNIYLPWAIRASGKAECLLNVYFEEEFNTPLEELRSRLGLEPAPQVDGISMTTAKDR